MISKLFMSAVSTCAWIRSGGEMRTKTAIEFCNLREVSCDFTQLRRLVVVRESILSVSVAKILGMQRCRGQDKWLDRLPYCTWHVR
jgi:hypothetical protein